MADVKVSVTQLVAVVSLINPRCEGGGVCPCCFCDTVVLVSVPLDCKLIEGRTFVLLTAVAPLGHVVGCQQIFAE